MLCKQLLLHLRTGAKNWYFPGSGGRLNELENCVCTGSLQGLLLANAPYIVGRVSSRKIDCYCLQNGRESHERAPHYSAPP